MNDLRSITFRVFSQSLLFTVLAFFSFPAIAQQSKKPALPKQFEKPSWLDCDIKKTDGSKDIIREKILYEYGAVYLSQAFRGQKDTIPCRFTQTEADNFVKSLKITANKFGFGDFYLQPQAKKSFETVSAIKGYEFFARNCNCTTSCKLTSKNLKDKINDDWALRTYKQTEDNWGFPESAIDIEKKEENIKSKIEKNDYMYDPKLPYSTGSFSMCINPLPKNEPNNKDNRPKMYKVAIPGSSQHHLGLAIDVINSQPRLCGKICTNELMKNGWFRTVRYDAYHFTYLGIVEKNTRLTEIKLRSMGLKKVRCKDYDEVNNIEYWVPNVNGYEGYKNWECK